jgi:multicomponent Na+:H+ antiporter subunit E
MNLLLATVLLALGFALASGQVSLPNLLLGTLVGALSLLIVRRGLGKPGYLGRALRILRLAGLFARELLLSALRVTVLVCRPDMQKRLRPAIVHYPLNTDRDIEIALLANLITLTPGTLSIDVTADKRFLVIHALEMGDAAAFRRDIAEGFERLVMEACR